LTTGTAVYVLTVIAVGSAAWAAPAPSLELALAGPEAVPAAGEGFVVSGEFAAGPDGRLGLGLGKDFGPAIPAAPFFDSAGTIAFTLWYAEPRPEDRLRNRHIVTLRMADRGFLGLYFIQAGRHLEMSYKQLPETMRLLTPAPLEAGRAYRAAVTWDGMTVCFYLDGRLVGEMAQGFPATYPPYARLNLGPYRDGWISAEPWGAEDVFVRDLKVWKEALDPLQIAAEAGIEVVSARARYPTLLAVPKAPAPTLDGKLDEPAWQRAASFVTLLDAVRPERSLTYPDNRPLLCHDGRNLYIGFETLFATGARIVPGAGRGEVEPEVWPDESFEFHAEVDGRLYRFAGNVAGGTCESLNGGSEFDGDWRYASTLEVRIDNRHHWQGEISIPFESLGIAEPVGRDLRVNFCRTWRSLDEVGITHLQAASQNYADREHFVTIRPLATAEGGIVGDSGDPSFGDLRQRLEVHSEAGGELSYTVRAVNASGDGPALMEQRVALEPGGRSSLEIDTALAATGAEHLLFELRGPQGETLLRQLVPFRLSEDYLEVTPVFGAGEVLVRPRHSMLLAKHPAAAPMLRLLGPDGAVLCELSIDSDEPRSLPFDPKSPPGWYVAELVSTAGGEAEVFAARRFSYTGPGDWALPPLEAVPPPFEPIQTVQEGQRVRATVWGREYDFGRSALPASIHSGGRELLAAPAALTVGGSAVTPDGCEVSSASAMRLDLAGSGETDACRLRQESWLEYDGVLVTRIVLSATEDLGAVTLEVPMPRQMAKFAHATASGFGGGGRQNLWLDRDHELPFYPSVWIGDEEGGLAWFCESAADWKTQDRRPIKIVRAGEQTVLQVTFADAVPAGGELALEFGLLATPVKPLPADYPLNLFADGYSVHLNRPAPRRPVISSGVVSWEGAGFFDLPLEEESPETWRWLSEHFRHFEENRAVLTPYTAAMMIPEEYAEAASRLAEWQIVPAGHLNYKRDEKTYSWYWTCPASEAGEFFARKFDRLLDRLPLRGIYLDFGPAFRCNNALHGCRDRYPLLRQRRLYQQLAAAFVRHGVTDYTIVVHNSECVQWPTFTHVTHFLNGEGLRQMSSTVFHDGKDLQDTYTRLDFACEHSSLPFGITSSVYVPTDPLLKEFGGGDEGHELYRFRMTKAALAGTLPHNTIPCPSRTHYGWYDKIVRIYEAFDVPAAEFLPYWRNEGPARVVRGKDIYVSLYRSPTRPEVLAVIAHISPEHLDQDVTVEFDPAELGMARWTAAEEQLTAPDPEYERLYAETNRIRMPIELGDFGVQDVSLSGDELSLHLTHHSVAIVKLTGIAAEGGAR